VSGVKPVERVMRWPGVITPGQIINEQAALQDLIPTFVAAAASPISSRK